MLNHHTHASKPIIVSLTSDVEIAVRREHAQAGIVDVTQLAEAIRKRHIEANIAREDVEHLVIQACGVLSAPMLLFSAIEDGEPEYKTDEIFAQIS